MSGEAGPVTDGVTGLTGADFLLALGREAFEGFVAGHHARAHGGRLRVEHAQAAQDALLLCGAKPVEAGLAAQRELLLLEGHVLVTLVPLGQVLAAGALRASIANVPVARGRAVSSCGM